ncbi:sensitivity to high expression protein she9 [Saitozyma podzolica]|uniref:Sensitive to high expression protein 9, mitochondrial n=1 Tax=Saitozyma podzolica TaxID=1890683 RepID=A0A427XYQ5_9TREE|nr:sensitivity to high expression protein she9 [Saitozyma podzolica]
MAAPRGVRVLRTFACALAPRGCIPARGVRYGPRSDIFLSSRRASSEATATASASRGDDHDPADLADRTLSQAPQEPVTSASSSPADSSDLPLRSLPSQPITPPNPSTISSPFAEPSTTRAGDPAASPLVTATATAAAQERLVALRAQLAGHSRNLADNAAKQLTLLGLRINEVTGYREVEALKDLVAERESQLSKLRESARAAKVAYDEAVSHRATSQSSVNTLLERKHAWTDSDVSRFATLVRADHASNLAVTTSSAALSSAEAAADRAFSDLMQAILRRYHEEQVWSDKIRSVSTYANLVGLVVNLVVFLGAVVVVEPWKRRKVEGEIAGLKEQIGMALAGSASTKVTTTVSETAPEQIEHKITRDNAVQVPVDHTSPIEVQNDQVDKHPSPYWATPLSGLPPSLDFVAVPSPERDLAAVGIGALAGGVVLAQLARAVFQ